MKVAYLDLGIFGIFEDYSILPQRYGGGRSLGAELKELNNFHIFANPKCFENVDKEENVKNCHGITDEQKERILRGERLIEVIPQLSDFNIVFHCHTNIYINTANDLKQVIWSVGFNEQIHKDHKYLLTYNDYQFPKIENQDIKQYRFQLGRRIPDFFIQRKKEDFIFQCTRHVPEFSSIEVASFCQRNKIKGIFAGPIADGYPLMNYIDNTYTFYHGQISEGSKLDFTKRAKLYTLLHSWPVPMSLSAIESLGYGTPIACTNLGFLPSLIKNKLNGFFCFNDDNLLEAWEHRNSVNQSDCYLSATKYNHFSMMSSVMECLDKIHSEV